MSMNIKTDPSMPENTMFLLPPDVQMAIDTVEHIESAYHKGRVSREVLEAAILYAKAIIRIAAKECRIGVLKNISL